MENITFEFDGKKYDAGNADQAYRATAFELPDGRGVTAEWIETMPPQIAGVSETNMSKLARPFTVVKVALLTVLLIVMGAGCGTGSPADCLRRKTPPPMTQPTPTGLPPGTDSPDAGGVVVPPDTTGAGTGTSGDYP